LSGAGTWVHAEHSGRSQVPLALSLTFQSQSLVAGLPQAHLWRRLEVQTIAVSPVGSL